MSDGSILYVVSRFPRVTETFVVNEWLALRGRFDMRIASLRRDRQSVVQPESRALLPTVWFLPVFRVRAVRAHASFLRREPSRYLRTFAILMQSAHRPMQLAANLLVFVKAVELASRARDSDIRHVHAHFANHPTTCAWVIHQLTGLSFSFTAHANDIFRGSAILERKLRDACFVVAISEYNAALISDVDPDVAVHVVHCGVDVDRFHVSAHVAAPRTVLCVASLEPKKGHRVLLDAVARLAGRYPDLRVILIGDGPERAALELFVRNRALTAQVEFRGAQPAAEVIAALQRAHVFVLASIRDASGRMEGIPVALMEAMAAGVPVVSTRLSGIPELLGDAGLLVAPGDADGLCEAVARVFDDAEVANTMALQARARVERQFSLVSQAQLLGDLFASAMSATAAAAEPCGARRVRGSTFRP